MFIFTIIFYNHKNLQFRQKKFIQELQAQLGALQADGGHDVVFILHYFNFAIYYYYYSTIFSSPRKGTPSFLRLFYI